VEVEAKCAEAPGEIPNEAIEMDVESEEPEPFIHPPKIRFLLVTTC
jgi:hypothetical protein